MEVSAGDPEVCILEDTPLETCILVAAADTTATSDRLGIGVLAAGTEITALQGDTTPQLELNVGRAEAGANAQRRASSSTGGTNPQTGLPATGADGTLVLPGLLLMGLSGASLWTMRRRRAGA